MCQIQLKTIIFNYLKEKNSVILLEKKCVQMISEMWSEEDIILLAKVQWLPFQVEIERESIF